MKNHIVLFCLLVSVVFAGYVGGSANSNVSGSDVTIDMSSFMPHTGDVIVVWGGARQRTGFTPGPVTEGYSTIAVTTGSQPATGVWCKVSDGDSKVVCRSTGRDEDAAAYGVMVLRGVDVSSIQYVETSGYGRYGPDPGAVNVVYDSAWALALGTMVLSYDTTPGTIVGYANDVTAAGDDVYDMTVAGATKFVAVAGSEDPGIWSSWSGGDWRAFTVVLTQGTYIPPDTTRYLTVDDTVWLYKAISESIKAHCFPPDTGDTIVPPDTGDTIVPPPDTTSGVYYISPDGNDSNSGTLEHPLKTIQAGVDKAVDGDTVKALEGAYQDAQVSKDGIVLIGNDATILGGVSIPGTWVSAPEVGDGVYKIGSLEPFVVTWDGYQVIKIHNETMKGNTTSSLPQTGFEILSFPEDYAWSYSPNFAPAPFWYDVKVIYGYLNDTTYIRFGDGRNPNSENLLATFHNRTGLSVSGSNVVVDGFDVRGYLTGIKVTGSNNEIQNCDVRNGNDRIELYGSNNVVHDCYFERGYHPETHIGEWDCAENSNMYAVVKFYEGHSSSADQGSLIGGVNNTFRGNVCRRGNIGIYLTEYLDAHVIGNDVESFSSVCVYASGLSRGSASSYITENRFAHGNILIRYGSVGSSIEDPGRRSWVWNNRFYNNPSATVSGACLRYHAGTENPDPDDLPVIFIYHNSFAGSATWACVTLNWTKTVVVNNVISVYKIPADTRAVDDANPLLLAGFDYNFCGGLYKQYRELEWMKNDPHNILYSNTLNGSLGFQVWELGTEPDWIVPDTSLAYQAGVDLSQPFTVRGTEYQPLPGMSPGYFSGPKPTMGIVR